MDGGNVKKPYSDRRWYDDVGAKASICNECKYRIPFVKGDTFPKCEAYPNGIPREKSLRFEGAKNIDYSCLGDYKYEPKQSEGKNNGKK